MHLKGVINFGSEAQKDLSVRSLVENDRKTLQSALMAASLGHSGLQITVPAGRYEGLLPVLKKLLKTASNWEIVWACDGEDLSAGILSSNGNQVIKLQQWAIGKDVNSQPQSSDFTSKVDFEAETSIWRNDVASVFLEEQP